MPKYSMEELMRQADLYHGPGSADPSDLAGSHVVGDSIPAKPVVPAKMPMEQQADIYHANPDRINDAADEHAKQRPMTQDEAKRLAATISTEYYATPYPLRPLIASTPLMQDQLKKAAKKGILRAENMGGALSYWASRPIQHLVTRPLAANMAKYSGDEESYQRLLQAIPAPGNVHKDDMPSNEQHDQLDDVVIAGAMPKKSWLEQDPKRWARKMEGDINAEDFLIMGQFGGDAEAYRKWMDQQSVFVRAGINIGNVIEDLAMPDPMQAVGEATKVIKLPFALVEEARIERTATALGVPKKALQGAVETYKIIKKGGAGQLERHIDALQKLLDAATEGSEEATRLQRRLWEAGAELSRRQAGAANPELGIYTVTRRDPKTIFQPMSKMEIDEVAARHGAAEAHATYGEVDVALREQGFGGIQDMHKRVEAAHDALAAGTEDAKHMSDLDALERLPENIKNHLNELGVSRKNVTRAAGLVRSRGFEGQFVKVGSHEAASQAALMGLDDSQEAALGIKHMVNGGEAADLGLHQTMAPELGNQLNVDVDGIIMRESPDYHKLAPSGLRAMTRDDALTHLLGRYSANGLGEASKLLDGGSVVRAANRVGMALKFGVGKYMPLSVRSFVPEIADIHKKAQRMFLLYANEGQEIMKDAFVKSGMAELKNGQLVTKDAVGLDHVLEMLDTPLDMGGKSEKLDELMAKASPAQKALHDDLRAWLDAWSIRLNMGPKGQAISGYFPHLFEKDGAPNARILEFLGLNPKAYQSYWMLKNRTANAEGFSRDIIHVLDLYNRGVSRAHVMEPAFAEMEKVIDGYRAAGRMDMAKYGVTFIKDAKGIGDPSWATQLADHLFGVGEGNKIRHAVEATTRQVTGLAYKGLLGGNLNFFIQNMAGGLNNLMAEHGPLGLLQGILSMATKEGREIAKNSGMMKESLLALENMPSNVKWLDQAYNVMDVGQRTEAYLRGLAVNTALQEQLKYAGKTWQEVRAAGLEAAYLKEAVETAERTQHTFGQLGRSPLMHTMLGHTGYHAMVQLGTYPFKQSEFLLRGMSRDPGFIMKYLAYSGIAARMGAEAGGIALGPGVGFGYMGSWTNPRGGRAVPLAPGPEMLASFIDFAVAHRGGDPKEVAMARDKLHRSMLAAAPFGLQYVKYARNLREALAGKTERFNERAPIGQVSKELLSGNVEIRHPGRELGSTEDRIMHALGIQTIGDRVETVSREFEKQRKFDQTREKMAKQENKEKEVSKYEDALHDYEKALKAGDFASAHMIYNQAASAGIMNFSGVGDQAAREASFLKQRLYFLKHAPGFMPIEEDEDQ